MLISKTFLDKLWPLFLSPFIKSWHLGPTPECKRLISNEASETWWETDNLRLCVKAGLLCGAAIVWLDVTSQLCQMLRLAEAAASQHSPLSPGPFHLRRQAAGVREIACSRWGPLTLVGPFKHCVLVICHLFLFFGLTTLAGRALQFCMRHKGGMAKEKRKKKSWRSLSSLQLKFSEIAGRQKKNQIKSQQKQSSLRSQKTCTAPSQFPSLNSPSYTTLSHRGVIKKKSLWP